MTAPAAPRAALLALLPAVLLAAAAEGAHAQDDPGILKRITDQAEAQILDQLETEYGATDAAAIPPAVADLFARGQEQADLLGEALLDSDMGGAREHFLSAMGYFKQVTRMMAAAPVAEGQPAAPDRAAGRDLSSELNRISKYVGILKTISAKHGAGADFGAIDSLIEQARREIAGGTGDPPATIDRLGELVNLAEAGIREHAYMGASDRAKQFVDEQLGDMEGRLAGALDAGADPSRVAEAHILAERVRYLIAEDEIDGAKSILRELFDLVDRIEGSV